MTDLPQKTIDLIPKPAADLEVEVVEGEVLLYHLQQTRAVYLNPTAALIWGLCDGSRSVGEIARLIGAAYPEALETLPDDVWATVKQLQENGVVAVS